jgi:hypothetical protein
MASARLRSVTRLVASTRSFLNFVFVLTLLGAGLIALIAVRSSGDPATPLLPGSAVSAPSTSPSIQIPGSVGSEKVADAQQALHQGLASEYGLTCFTAARGMLYMPAAAGAETDRLAEAARLTAEGWAKDGLWVGSAETAAAAFGATAAFDDQSSIWILVGGKEPIGARLHRIDTPAGRVAWILVDAVRACGTPG